MGMDWLGWVSHLVSLVELGQRKWTHGQPWHKRSSIDGWAGGISMLNVDVHFRHHARRQAALTDWVGFNVPLNTLQVISGTGQAALNLSRQNVMQLQSSDMATTDMNISSNYSKFHDDPAGQLVLVFFFLLFRVKQTWSIYGKWSILVSSQFSLKLFSDRCRGHLLVHLFQMLAALLKNIVADQSAYGSCLI